MKIVLIVNPRSGGKKGKKSLNAVERELALRNIEFDLRLTEHSGHVASLLGELDISKYDGVVSLGGDGTNYEVLNSLLMQNEPSLIPPIGIIPTGSGNSFAKDLSIASIDDGISALEAGNVRPVDVCSFTQDEKQHYFVNLTGFGFVTDVAKTAAGFKFLGDFSYIIGVLYRTIGLKFHQMELEVDGKTISGKNCFVEFCNSRYTGGGMLMAPNAKIDDGFFDIVIAAPLGRTSLIGTFPKIFKGAHGEHPAVTVLKAKCAKVVTIPPKTLLPDGEIFGETPTEINIHPGLVRYYCLDD
ncbi:MAG: diacylglycerol kinase family lipid kinase [Proteobacteria bacterium]|nr:diacylglycerol kinase family lipid kinase [Pseudomonadota bacterium]